MYVEMLRMVVTVEWLEVVLFTYPLAVDLN